MTDSQLRELARALTEGAPSPPPWPEPASIERPSQQPSSRPSSRRLLLVALAAVLVFVIAATVMVRVLGDDGEHAASRPSALSQQNCIVRLTASPAQLCVTSYDANQIGFIVSGFEPHTPFLASTPDRKTSAGSRTNSAGTNIPPKSKRTGTTLRPDAGTVLSASAPILALGTVVTGIAANGTTVTFFVPAPAGIVTDDTTMGRTEVTPDTVTIVDDTHLSLGLPCATYGPGVQVKETAKTVGVSAFYTPPRPGQGRLACLQIVVVVLRSPVGNRSIVSNIDGGKLLTN